MAILVSNEDVKSNSGFGRTIKQLIDLYIHPTGVDEFQIALIEFFDDQNKPPIVHFNEDVQIQIKFKEAKLTPESVGKSFDVRLDNIAEITWVDENLDGDSGKAMLFACSKDIWILDFKFIYNSEYTQRRAQRAKDFLESAKRLDPESDRPAIIYLLWSAGELLIDAKLATLHGQRIGSSFTSKEEEEEEERFH